MDANSPREHSKWHSLYWAGIPLSLIILLCSIFLAIKLRNNEIEQLQHHLQSAAQLTIAPIKMAVEFYSNALLRMKKRWQVAEGTPKRLWYVDAGNFYTDTRAFYALEWLNNKNEINWIVPSIFSSHNQQMLTQAPLNHYLEQAKQSKQLVLSEVFDSPQFQKALLMIIPLYTTKGFDGYLIGIVNVDKLFNEIFKRGVSEGLGLSILQGNKVLYTLGAKSTPHTYTQEEKIRIFNIEWTLIAWPTGEFVQHVLTPLPVVTLISGLTAAILIFILFYFYNESQINSEESSVAHKESKRSEERIRRILETINEGFMTIDENAHVLFMNACAEELLGWKKAELIGKDIHEVIIPARYRQMHRDGIKEAIATGASPMMNQEIEFLVLRKNGTECLVEAVVIPLKEDGKYQFHCFFRNITARKKAESDQSRLAAIVAASDDAIVSADMKGKVLTWNRGAERLYGYSAEEMLGQFVSVLYLPDEAKALKMNLERLKAGESIYGHDSRRRRKDGTIIPISIVIFPITNKKGVVIGAASISRDITERKHIEKMKNEFISIVSHELRTPLTSIRGSIGLLASEKVCPLPPPARQLLNIANTNCERLIRLINDILDIEKIESGKMDFHFKLVDVNTIIREAVESSQALAQKSEVKIEFNNTEKVEVQIDSDRIMQVIVNLISNAIRYSPINGVVTIAITKLVNKVRVSVTDTGPGIPKEFREKIFGRFAQADSSDTRKRGGTGLGLSISKAIIEKHHGDISFITTEGKGSTFYFDLPTVSSDTHETKTSFEMEYRILVYDTNHSNGQKIGRLLAEHHMQIDIAHTIDEAKILAQEHVYQGIVFSTFNELVDPLLIQYFKENSRTAFLPIIIIQAGAKALQGKIIGHQFVGVNWVEKPTNELMNKDLLNMMIRKFRTSVPNILCVEDDKDIIQLVSIMLQDKARVWNVNSLAKARKLLANYEFNLVILDLHLSDGFGGDLLPCVNFKTNERIPVVVFSIEELPAQYKPYVTKALLKSIAKNEDLYKAIMSSIQLEEVEHGK